MNMILITNDDGIHIGGIVGFLKSIGYAIKTHSPTRCVIVFDGKGGSQRRRKILRNALKNLNLQDKFHHDIFSKRAEELSINDFELLAQNVNS